MFHPSPFINQATFDLDLYVVTSEGVPPGHERPTTAPFQAYHDPDSAPCAFSTFSFQRRPDASISLSIHVGIHVKSMVSIFEEEGTVRSLWTS